ncbi:ferric reductase-like transmembrane domain-containing protein [Actinospica robiniae]|uniref:ferric reductase-like transmembrane domain-containing protein n=1 Tax=Actinospica robiniae TaxID=304901 RepID=UPI00041E085D|nr:ferric reductase-like transmembrane domain-containing protein [Actinospica robiniae]
MSTNTLFSDPLWFTTRATGTITLGLVTLTVVLGVAGAVRYAPAKMGRFEVAALHRNLSLLSLAVLGVHIGTALADTFVPIGWSAVVVPFLSPYRTTWVGLGTIAFDLLLAVYLTSAVRLRIGQRRWKAVHLCSYAAWPIALFHAAGTGSDTRLGLQITLYSVCLAVVLGAVGWRIYTIGPGHLAARAALAAASVGTAAGFYGFLAAGPLAPNWSHRAQHAQSTVLIGEDRWSRTYARPTRPPPRTRSKAATASACWPSRRPRELLLTCVNTLRSTAEYRRSPLTPANTR